MIGEKHSVESMRRPAQIELLKFLRQDANPLVFEHMTDKALEAALKIEMQRQEQEIFEEAYE